jgi:hypothetical protein
LEELLDGINQRFIRNFPFDRTGAISQSRDTSSAIIPVSSFALGGISTAIGTIGFLNSVTTFAGLPASVVALPTAILGIGVILGVVGLVLAILSFPSGGNRHSETDYFEGFFFQHPLKNSPAGAATVMFDIYVSPNDSPTATIRAANEFDGRDSSLTNENESPDEYKDVWFVQFPSLPDDPNANISESEGVKLITPDSQEWPSPEEFDDGSNDPFDSSDDPLPPNPDDHDIAIQSEDLEASEALIETGPIASFSIGWRGKKSLEEALSEAVAIVSAPFLEEGERTLSGLGNEIADTGRLVRSDDPPQISRSNPGWLKVYQKATQILRDQNPIINRFSEQGSTIEIRFNASGTLLGGSKIEMGPI